MGWNQRQGTRTCRLCDFHRPAWCAAATPFQGCGGLGLSVSQGCVPDYRVAPCGARTAQPVGLFALLPGSCWLRPAAPATTSDHLRGYPKDIHTVYVPIFESASFRPDLGERLTKAVVKRIEEVTPLKVVNSAGDADSVLIGQIRARSSTSCSKQLQRPPRDPGRAASAGPLGRPSRQHAPPQLPAGSRAPGDHRRDRHRQPGPRGRPILCHQALQQAIQSLATQIVGLMETFVVGRPADGPDANRKR